MAKINHETSAIRYAHLHALVPLYLRRADLEARDTENRRRRDATFPTTAAEYQSIWNKDVQVRIARFLTSERLQQDKMMTEFGWAWRQVQPLLDLFKTDVSTLPFICRTDHHVFSWQTNFKGNVMTRLKDVEVRDPRKKYR